MNAWIELVKQLYVGLEKRLGLISVLDLNVSFTIIYISFPGTDWLIRLAVALPSGEWLHTRSITRSSKMFDVAS